MCGTSASSAPSVTIICTPSTSASSTMPSQNVRQRIDGSGPGDEDEVARGARRVRGRTPRPRATRSSRVTPSTSLIGGPRGLEVEELLGIEAGEARRAELRADERQRRRGGLAGVVPAAEGADERRGPEAVRTALPDQWLHPGHGTSWARVADRPSGSRSRRRGRRRSATATRRRRLRLHAQGPADDAHGVAVPRARAARPHRRRSPRRVFRDADLLGRALRARRPRPRARAASSGSATSCRSR